jgi:hypothetical protein
MSNHKPDAAELASVILTHPNLRPSEIAAARGLTRQHVSAVGARLGVKHRAGRPPTDALTPRSARGKRLVAALALIAEAWSMTPEAVLLSLAEGGIADADPTLAAKLKVILEAQP